VVAFTIGASCLTFPGRASAIVKDSWAENPSLRAMRRGNSVAALLASQSLDEPMTLDPVIRLSRSLAARCRCGTPPET
jgi:hypothetical protein